MWNISWSDKYIINAMIISFYMFKSNLLLASILYNHFFCIVFLSNRHSWYEVQTLSALTLCANCQRFISIYGAHMQNINKTSEERPTTSLKNTCLCSKYSHIRTLVHFILHLYPQFNSSLVLVCMSTNRGGITSFMKWTHLIE